MSRDAVESMGMYFTQKEIQLMKKACGALSKEELMQRLGDPPKKFRPSTNMNSSGNMAALKLTYEDSKQYGMGVARHRQIKTAYQMPKKHQDVLRVDQHKNTYINYPNKSYEILRKKQVPQSKIMAQASDPRVT